MVTNEQLDYELNACSFEPIHAQTHLEKMLLNLLAQSISISNNHQQLDRENLDLMVHENEPFLQQQASQNSQSQVIENRADTQE